MCVCIYIYIYYIYISYLEGENVVREDDDFVSASLVEAHQVLTRAEL